MPGPLRRAFPAAAAIVITALAWQLTAASAAPAHLRPVPARPPVLQIAAPPPGPADAAVAIRRAHLAAAARSAPAPVTAAASARPRPGDSLSALAARYCHDAADWPSLWRANLGRLPRNPSALPRRAIIRLDCRRPSPATAARAMAAIPKPPPPPPPPANPAPASSQLPAPVSYAASGFEACVIAAESGGNPAAVNPSSGAGGLYQFLPSTWQSLGYSGSPQDAPPSVQRAAFEQLYASQGSAPWSSDGC